MKHTYIGTPDQVPAALERLLQERSLGVDCETYPLPRHSEARYKGDKPGVDPHRAAMRLVSVACQDGTVYVFDMLHVAPQLLAPLAERHWLAHNAVFDWSFMHAAGVPTPVVECTQIMDRVINGHSTRTLDALAKSYLRIDMDKALQRSDWAVPELSTEQIEYAGLDALAAVRLGSALLPELSQRGSERVYKLLRDTARHMREVSHRGLLLDWGEHAALTRQLEAEHLARLAEFKCTFGAGINPGSAPQLTHWLLNNVPHLILRQWPRTKEGLKTDKNTLPRFVHDVPELTALINYRKVATLYSTFAKRYHDYRNSVTGRVHSQYRIPGARTGRSSSSAPNLQQIPRRQAFRRLFVPDPDYVLVGCDFSQIEMRVAALLSGDERMLDVYRNNKDLHSETAAAVTGITADQVADNQRQSAKVLNFGSIYGMGPDSLRTKAKLDYGVDMTAAEAMLFLDRHAQAFPALSAWKSEQAHIADETQTTSTRLGLVRDLRREDAGDRHRQAFNTPVQGSSAEVLYAAICALVPRLPEIGGQLLMQVHDELLIQVPAAAAYSGKRMLEAAMRAGLLAVFPEADELGLADLCLSVH